MGTCVKEGQILENFTLLYEVPGIEQFSQNPNFKDSHPYPMPTIAKKLLLDLSSYGFTAQNTLCGLSICPDEINHEDFGFTYSHEKVWGQVFPMGGLSGIPFTGKTGYGAYSHHVPENGNVFICYGSHVGITKDKEVGKIHRLGIHEATTCCGAAIAAMNSVLSGKEAGTDVYDMQQNYLTQQMKKFKKDLEKASSPNVELSVCTYKIIDNFVRNIVKNDLHGDGKVAFCGGVYVNTPAGYQDVFLPLNFQVIKKSGEVIKLPLK